MSSSEASLSTGQIIAIAVSVAASGTFLITVPVVVRCYIVRRRWKQQQQPQHQYNAKEIPKRELRVSSDNMTPQIERGSTNEPRTSATNTTRSSIWGETRPSVVLASVVSDDGDVWDSRRWPLPPGHSERYTFFSERSSVDDTSEAEELGEVDKDEQNKIK
ncbi:hypothetical protein F5Y11DRAFT_44671 [Daldinia sp. FL1419]|nr:hypothetical protein F5Y11DRAFT_44671 [Daldinia sp. FL1419]